MTFEQLRRQGIGGSDMNSVLSIEPYGCSRRLWFTKQGIEPDHPRKTNVLDRGHALEEIVCQWVATTYGLELKKCETVRDPRRPWLFCHPDRIVVTGNGSAIMPGDVIEAKTAGREIFSKMKRDGLPEEYVAQGQYNAELVYRQTGVAPARIHFPVLWPDGWEFALFTLNRDAELGADMAAVADEWWAAYQAGEAPERLNPGDRRCQSCEYRTQCQGQRLLEIAEESGDGIPFVDPGDEVIQAIEDYKAMKEIEKEAKDEADSLKARIEEWLANRPAIEVPGYRIFFRATQREGFTVKPSVVRSLRIYAK